MSSDFDLLTTTPLDFSTSAQASVVDGFGAPHSSIPLQPPTQQSSSSSSLSVVSSSSNTPGVTESQRQGQYQRILVYTDEFPSLPQATRPDAAPSSNENGFGGRPSWANGVANRPPGGRRVAAANVTQVFHLPADDRRFHTGEFGEKGEQQECNDIMQATGTHIELSESKDHSLTIVVSGKRQSVEEARILIVKRLQSQALREISIPKEHHRALIGKEGKRVAEMESSTSCRIMIPKRDDPSDIIRISGPREGIESAVHEIRQFSDEQSKLAVERLQIPRIYYPWIKGPNNQVVDGITQRTKARVHIPPPSSPSDVIVVAGEKEGVHQAAREIRKIFEEKAHVCQTVSIQVATSQHRYVAGPQAQGIAEILRDTDVSVELPPKDSDCSTIVLRGPQEKLGQALGLVYAKASSVIQDSVTCPSWLHKFIIGPKGQNLKKIIGDPPTVEVDFSEENNTISIEGSPSDVKMAKSALSTLSSQLQKELCFEVLHVPPSSHRHIIGRNGTNINRIKDETGVLVHIPDENQNSDEVRLEGKKEGVASAKQMIVDIVKRVEQRSFTLTVEVPHKLHPRLIGQKGVTVNRIRQDFDVNISIPKPDDPNPDVITLQGPEKNTRQAKAEIEKLVPRMEAQSLSVTRDYHVDEQLVNPLGRGIRKIREEHPKVRILFPRQQDEDQQTLHLVGLKEDIEKCMKCLDQTINELKLRSFQLTVEVPHEFHPRLIGQRGVTINKIRQDFDVNISIPKPDDPNPDVITLQGHEKNARDAKAEIEKLVRRMQAITQEYHVPPQYMNLLGRNMKKLHDANPDVRILFPRGRDENPEMLHLVGQKEDVEKCKHSLDEAVAELEARSFSLTVEVPVELHTKLIGLRGATINKIREDFDVVISIPKADDANPEMIMLQGFEKNTQGAKAEIENWVRRMQAIFTQQITLDCRVHSRLIGPKGRNIKKIMDEFSVEIRFPRQNDPDPNLVIVSGENEDKVYDCIDELRNMEEEFLQDVVDRTKPRGHHPLFNNNSISSAPGAHDKPQGASEQVLITHGPWAPNTGSIEEFPSIGTEAAAANGTAGNAPVTTPTAPPAGVWGRRM